MPSTPPSSRKAAFVPDATPSSDFGRVPSTTEASGTKNSVMPTPHTTNGAIMSAYGVVGVRIDGQPGQADGLQRQAGDDQGLAAPALGQLPDERGEHHGDGRPRQDPDAGLRAASSPARSGGTGSGRRWTRTSRS